ncbi:MAG: coproporphyrinogen III oxidase family protein [Christensenellaceae bacterium]|jgi:oxygen-independent coproporphyrinogen-3 oxidase|nr:coproporphyrinogen III oxidase family protein [Christensenellaceae bacterium]
MVGIYLHIPFCKKRCTYCDFFSSTDLIKVDSYVEKLRNDIKIYFAGQNTPPAVGTIYIGGGTPSLLTNEQMMRLFSVLPNANEITIECNPESLTEEKLLCYKKLGINRVSIGVQSFDGKTLQRFGRLHTVKEAKEKIVLAKKFFDNVSIDLISTDKRVKIPNSILKIITHISIYDLTKNDKTVYDTNFHYKFKHFQRYEVSNYSKISNRAGSYQCRHNLNYWNCGEWLAFGDGAIPSHEFNQNEKIMMGMRTIYGVDKDMVRADGLSYLLKQKLVQISGGKVIASKKGFDFLNKVIYILIYGL